MHATFKYGANNLNTVSRSWYYHSTLLILVGKIGLYFPSLITVLVVLSVNEIYEFGINRMVRVE